MTTQQKPSADSVKVACRAPRGGGGSIPASALFYHVGMIDDAKRLVKTYHYSHSWPTAVDTIGTLHLAGGLFGTAGEAVAAVVFAHPQGGYKCGRVLELARLVRANARVPLTMLISLACGTIKRARQCDLLVSYADKSHGHHGGVYLAACWNCWGERGRRVDGFIVDGVRMSGREVNARYGTQSTDKLRMAFPRCTFDPSYDQGKVLFWKALNRAGREKAKRLGLETRSGR